MCVNREMEEQGFCGSCKKSRNAKIAGVLSGIAIGVLCGVVFVLINWFLEKQEQSDGAKYLGYETGNGKDVFHNAFRNRYIGIVPTVTLRKPLYVGVLTMERHINSRAESCNQTWAKNPLISKVEYFARFGASSAYHKPHGSNIINLTNIQGSDLYHRSETFRMLEYICDNHIEEYDWFVRAVDDVYIKPDRLLALLANVDKNKMYYIGHPSPGENEIDQIVTGGRQYCMGGPAIVFSRPALQGLCPHVRDCERKYNMASADAELGRCVFNELDMQCTLAGKFREKFYNSYERNVFKLVEEFMYVDSAITLHPLKTDWLMAAVHRHVASGALTRLSQRLTWLSGREESLAVSVMSKNRSGIFDTKAEDLVPIPVTVVTPKRQEFNPGTCHSVTNMTNSAVAEFSKAIKIANASFLYGDNLQCRRLVDAHFLRGPDITTNYVTKMLCNSVTQPNHTFVTSAIFEEPHTAYVIKRKRRRRVKSKMVVFLHTYYTDPKVLEFLVMWKNLLEDKRSSDHLLILFLVYNPRKHRHSPLDMEFALSDLDRWKRDRRLNIITYPFNSSIHTQTMHQIALSNLDKKFKDAVVLLAQPHLKFDDFFLKKCRFLVRPGKHIYRPMAEENMIFRHRPSVFSRDEVSQSHWRYDGAPICVHARDLLRRKKQTKSGTRRKQIKVINSFDMNLHIDSL